jgi:hypothetical protein
MVVIAAISTTELPDVPGTVGIPPNTEIRQELSRIIASTSFRDSLRLTNFLTFIVETTLTGNGNRIKSYTVALEALGRDSNFDPQTDPIVRVEAGRLRRALAHYYAIDGRDNQVVIDLPRGSYVPTFRRSGSPTGLRKNPFRGRLALFRPIRRRLRLFALIAIVAFSASLLPDFAILAWQRLNDRALATSRGGNSAQLPGPPLPQLYVEPVNVSGFPLSNSISSSMFYQRLIDAMARFDDLTVLAAPPAGAGSGPPDYSLASAIHYYADGAASVAISATDATDGGIIWSKTYEGREHDAVPEKKGRMVREMTMTLLQPFGVIASREAAKRAAGDNMEDPYRCVLNSHEYLRSYDFSRRSPVRACLEAATVKAPSWVSPFVQLARVDMRDYQFGVTDQPHEAPALDRAFAAASRAIQLKPSSAAAYNVLQDVLLARGDFTGARRAGEIALNLNQYDRVVVFGHAFLLVLMGEAEDGLALMHQVTTDNPVMPSRFHFIAGLAAYLQGDLRGAAAETAEIPVANYPPALMLRALVAAKMDDRALARQTLDRLYAAYPAWQKDPRESLHRFLPDAAMVDRIATEFAAATTTLTQ